ncbi:MAG: HlyD family efflux transporter periplasmic adaptor subunit [Halomonas sp.]|uniref:efflux RND transporter periplasmic adaptor subunit n=1 Tax=Halomonas sp. TaxID=1486246 RepID=UPI002ACD634B|nr:HlyD family efflux transporter periplasmic adaptor subunit [Halomonas sp.]MDZ7852835.1 HlyD family efflux transporter periplasmic adaptor subunit [Halomonas sp.]
MLRRLLPLLILALGVAVFLWLRATRPESASVTPEERAWRVETLKAVPERHAPALPLYGEVTAPETLRVTAPLAGRIAERPVREGQRVARGELLVALDEADIRPPVDQAEAEVADREAQLENERVRHESDRDTLVRERELMENASRQLERTRSLVERNLASQSDLDTARNELARARVTVAARERAIAEHPARLQSLQAGLARARAVLAAARRDAARSRVDAPFDGIVTRIRVAPGDQVAARSELLSVYPEEGLELRARIPRRYQTELRHALAEDMRIEATGDEGARFVLVGLAGESDPAGTEAIFRLEAGGSGLRPGSLLALSLARPAIPDSFPVPDSALYGNDILYLMNDEGRMQRLVVTRHGEVIRNDGERWALVSGESLDEGDRVITTHLPNAIQGLKVETTEPGEETQP